MVKLTASVEEVGIAAVVRAMCNGDSGAHKPGKFDSGRLVDKGQVSVPIFRVQNLAMVSLGKIKGPPLRVLMRGKG